MGGLESIVSASAAELLELTDTLPKIYDSPDAESTSLYERLAGIGGGEASTKDKDSKGSDDAEPSVPKVINVNLPTITDTPAVAVMNSPVEEREGDNLNLNVTEEKKGKEVEAEEEEDEEEEHLVPELVPELVPKMQPSPEKSMAEEPSTI